MIDCDCLCRYFYITLTDTKRTQKMKKLIFTFAKADSKTRTLGIIAIALAVLAIGLIIFGASKTINGPFTDISIVKMVLSEVEMEELEGSFEDSVDELEEAIDSNDDERLDEIEEELGVGIDEVLDLFDPISLKSVDKLARIFEIENAGMIAVVIAVVRMYAAVLIALVFFSILGMNKGFFITSVALSSLFFLMFAGMPLFLVFLGLCIAYCVLISGVKRAYIMYKQEQKKLAEAPVVVEEA